jgi:hypothetical protein
VIKYLYQNELTSGVRRNFVPLFDGDAIVTTSYKVGTTWTHQALVYRAPTRRSRKPSQLLSLARGKNAGATAALQAQ